MQFEQAWNEARHEGTVKLLPKPEVPRFSELKKKHTAISVGNSGQHVIVDTYFVSHEELESARNVLGHPHPDFPELTATGYSSRQTLKDQYELEITYETNPLHRATQLAMRQGWMSVNEARQNYGLPAIA